MNNFTISLYAFHLQRTFNDALDEVSNDADKLWEYLVKLGEEQLQSSKLKDLKSKLICYEEDGTYAPQREQGRQSDCLTNSGSLINLGKVEVTQGLSIKVEIQPFRLNDTYAIDLALSPEDPYTFIDEKQVKYFKPSYLLPSSEDASLGKTLWLYGKVDYKNDGECKQLAEEYAKALLKETSLKPVLVNNGKLLGSLLFEYQVSYPKEPQNPAEKCRILISINNNQAQTVELAINAYDWILNLFCCYHKIIYIYHQSRQIYPEARKFNNKLNNHISTFSTLINNFNTTLDNTALDKFNNLLKEASPDVIKYTRYLRELKAHHTAITTNIANYHICLEQIGIIGEYPQFWNDFFIKICRHWQQHIQIEIDYLSPGEDLFKQMVDTIRGIVAIEQTNLAIQQAETDRVAAKARADAAIQQAESDRVAAKARADAAIQKAESDRATQTILQNNEQKLQTTIATMGFGIGAASVGATTSVYLIPPPQQQRKLVLPFTPGADQPHPVVYSLLFAGFCGLLGVFAGMIADYIYRFSLKRRQKRRQSRLNKLRDVGYK